MDHLIAYIDILGFKNLLGHEVSKAKERLKQIYDMAELTNIISREEIKFIAISDSVLFSQPLQKNAQMGEAREKLKSFINAVSLFQRNAATHGILVRGGVTFGQLEVFTVNINVKKGAYSQNFLGQGFVRALDLESCAIFPRIIIDPSILTSTPFGYLDLKGFLVENNRDVMFRPPPLIGCSSIEFESNDYPFIHYLGKSSIETYDFTSKEIGKILTSKNVNRSTLEKVGWVAQYMKYCLMSHKGKDDRMNQFLGRLGFT